MTNLSPTTDNTPTDLLARAGGLEGLRSVLKTFYDLVFDDIMIGFYFANADKSHLVEREVELTARALGHDEIRYTGQPLKQAHAPHRIVGGHFDRRTVLLRKAFDLHDLDPDVRAAWLRHNAALRHLITVDATSDCDHGAAAARADQFSEPA